MIGRQKTTIYPLKPAATPQLPPEPEMVCNMFYEFFEYLVNIFFFQILYLL